jgi:hypothetical protein
VNAAALLLCTLAAPADVPEAALPCVRPSDRFRFPPEEVLESRIRFAERHLAWLDARAAALGPDWAAREYDYRVELNRRLDLWRDARLAAVNTGDPPVCAACLRELRRGLGVAAYNAGELPELPDPAWFSRGD